MRTLFVTNILTTWLNEFIFTYVLGIDWFFYIQQNYNLEIIHLIINIETNKTQEQKMKWNKYKNYIHISFFITTKKES